MKLKKWVPKPKGNKGFDVAGTIDSNISSKKESATGTKAY
jgi:hypothetical protein